MLAGRPLQDRRRAPESSPHSRKSPAKSRDSPGSRLPGHLAESCGTLREPRWPGGRRLGLGSFCAEFEPERVHDFEYSTQPRIAVFRQPLTSKPESLGQLDHAMRVCDVTESC